MTKITQFDRHTTKALQDAIDAALADVAKRFDVDVKRCRARFSPTSVNVSFEVATTGTAGEVFDAAAKDLERFARLHDLPVDAHGKLFAYAGHTFKLVGYKPGAPKMPFIGERIGDGKRFKFAEAAVASLKQARAS